MCCTSYKSPFRAFQPTSCVLVHKIKDADFIQIITVCYKYHEIVNQIPLLILVSDTE